MGDNMKILKDQRGLTIVELVSSFTITMVALVFLFNIVVILKESYILNSTKSNLIVEQSLISRTLNEDLYNGATEINKATCPSGYDWCYKVKLEDGTTKDLQISFSNDELKYGNNVLSDESLQFNSINSDVCWYTNDDASESKNSMLLVKVYIESSLIENYEFGINVIHLYDPNEFDVDSTIQSCY